MQGLSEAQERLTPTVSSLSRLTLLKQSTIWERRWFQMSVDGRSLPGEWPEVRSQEVDSTFRLTDEDRVEPVVADYRAQIAASNEVLTTLDLDAPRAWWTWPIRTCEWVALHMIEKPLGMPATPTSSARPSMAAAHADAGKWALPPEYAGRGLIFADSTLAALYDVVDDDTREGDVVVETSRPSANDAE